LNAYFILSGKLKLENLIRIFAFILQYVPELADLICVEL
jgi:hypothetical protein